MFMTVNLALFAFMSSLSGLKLMDSLMCLLCCLFFPTEFVCVVYFCFVYHQTFYSFLSRSNLKRSLESGSEVEFQTGDF